jgi:predicted DNA-binding transcriptional regulator AlpA
MDKYSTRSAAKELGISLMSMMRYIKAGKIPAPPAVKVGGGIVRAWTKDEIEKVRKVLPTIANGRKTRHKKKQSAVSKQQSAKTKTQPRAPQPRHAKNARTGGPKAVPHKSRKPKKK